MAAAQKLAEAVAEAMYARDFAAQALGIVIETVGPGTSRLAMTVRPDMVNGHDMCHGGMIFTLADTALAYACNSYNQVAVAQTAQITFCAPGRKGDRLVAVAEERHQAGRTGVYDVRVTDPAGKTIALFRGNSYRLQGTVVPEPAAAG
ncbi:hydroxyphenylacetyl-CoA thioesterase PaaI [Desertibaculum subflavum]|uniref:hydroxyphenylacetyl-CoA thioesterase PaaI n=1 Tax=Desertibaculum subflavum TaxID=2268458 RepID=UPI000E66C273